MDITLSGTQVLLSFAAISVIIICVIVLVKWRFYKQSLSTKDIVHRVSQSCAARVKYPEVDILRHSMRIFGFSLAASMALVIMGFAWTKYDREIDLSGYTLLLDDIIEIEPPRTPPEEKKLPPPKEIEDIPEEDIPEEDQTDLEDMMIDEETVFDETLIPIEKEALTRPIPPPPPPIIEDEDEIFVAVGQMPLFGGCKDRACSDEKLIRYLQDNLKYPTIARENGIEGRVTIQFVIEKDGKVSDVRILHDIGGGCGTVALKVVENMNNLAISWQPGLQRGKPVRVRYTLPATFKLAK